MQKQKHVTGKGSSPLPYSFGRHFRDREAAAVLRDQADDMTDDEEFWIGRDRRDDK